MKMDHLPARGESVMNAEFLQMYGGKGANQAVAAARAGTAVTFLACVGDDPYADEMVAGYEASGVDVSRISRESGVSSGTAMIMIGEAGNNLISVAPGANFRFTPDRLEKHRELFQHAGHLLVQNEIPPETVDKAIELAHASGVQVVLNYAPASPPGDRSFADVDFLVVNETEAQTVTGIAVTDGATAERAARAIIDRGVKTAIVTLGEAGSLLVTGRTSERVPAFAVEAVDTTAAGDTYCGALVVALAEGLHLAEAVRFASAAAALSVQVMGAQPSAPERDAIDAFLSRQR